MNETCPDCPSGDADDLLSFHQRVVEILPTRSGMVRNVVGSHHLKNSKDYIKVRFSGSPHLINFYDVLGVCPSQLSM